jgi:hypothetical protein
MYLISEKGFSYSIGWFRLHEATIKNEHERAFLNYRLLMHSYIDEAYQKEVKAYLHYFFGEYCDALRLFREAFILYFENKAYISAIMVYKAMKELNTSCADEYKQLKEIIEKDKKKYSLFVDIFTE